MISKIKQWWQGLSRSVRRWLVFAAISSFIIIIWIAYLMIFRGYTWPESGFNSYMAPDGVYYPPKTLWDILALAIVPLVLALGAYWFNKSEKANDRRIADQRIEEDRRIAEDRQKEQALQGYIDKMTELTLDEYLLDYRDYLGEPVVKVAKVRTVTTLRILDLARRNILLQYLRDSGLDEFVLIGASLAGADLSKANLWRANLVRANLRLANMERADLKWANLVQANLWEANLTGAWLMQANLSEANLIEANLSRAYLGGAILTGADLTGGILSGANLEGANLWEADLSGANLYRADLSNADLRGADLSGADLSGANLNGAILWGADMSKADLSIARNVTDEQLATAISLEGATMPDGSIHE